MTSLLVTGAGGAAAANFIDALRRGSVSHRVIGADVSPYFLHLSKADERLLIPGPSEESYKDALNEAASRWGLELIHPQPDPEVLAIGRIRHELETRVFLPSQEALETAADKGGAQRVLAASGVPVPSSNSFDEIGDVGEKTASLLQGSERVWIRARRGAGARGSLPVSRPEQAVAWVRWWMEERGLLASDFMAAEFLPGAEFAYQSVWQNGELVTGQLRRRLLYLYGSLTPSGQTSSPSLAVTAHVPQADQAAISAVRALDESPEGVYCIDLKESEEGTVKVTEVNAGRFFTTSNFFAAAGLNMPEIYVRCALGEKPHRTGSSPLPAGLHWVRMMDMGYTLVPEDEIDRWPGSDR